MLTFLVIYGRTRGYLVYHFRFTDGKKDFQESMAWIPFGSGPRTCAGMRFAVVEYKIALARLLKKFSVRPCSKTKIPCPVRQNGVHSPSEGVYVTLESRSGTLGD